MRPADPGPLSDSEGCKLVIAGTYIVPAVLRRGQPSCSTPARAVTVADHHRRRHQQRRRRIPAQDRAAGADGPGSAAQPRRHHRRGISLRAIPGLLVFRPADASEVAETWRIVTALRHEPAVLILSRQALPTLDRNTFAPASGVARGAYVLAEADSGEPDVILLATGSEVHLALAARDEVQPEGIATRVVSMRCRELFDRQP
jgi:hypothetical protein